jgi:hypothetical protein
MKINPLKNLLKLSLLLSGLGIPLCANGLTISPPSASLKPGESQVFSAADTENVAQLQWVTVKGNLQLTGNKVRYTAPYQEGTYSVAVTDGSDIALAVVEVTELEETIVTLEILGGENVLTVGARQALSLRAWLALTELTEQDYTEQATWESDDPSILEVSNNGQLTAHNPGEATISARVGEEHRASITIEVQPKTTAVGLVIEPSPVYIPTGGMQTLDIQTIFRDNHLEPIDTSNCSFTSDAEQSVTVNGAELQAISAGYATIKANCDSLQASTPVFVSEPFELATNPSFFRLGVEKSKPFQIIGGMPPYGVKAHTGRVTGSGESWRYHAAQFANDDDVTITDQAGDSVTLKVTVVKGMVLSPLAVNLSPSTTIDFFVSGGQPPYTWHVSAGQLNKHDGTDVNYTAPEVRGVYQITVKDNLGNAQNAVINVGAGLIATPNQFVLEPEEQKRFQITGGKPPYTLSTDRGKTQQEEEAYYYEASSVSGNDKIKVRDSEARSAIISVTVTPALKVTPSELFLRREEEAQLNISGGHGQYTPTAQLGEVEEKDGQISYQAPKVAGHDVITVKDQVGNVAQVNVLVSQTGFYVSPIESYLLPDETTQVRALGGTPPYTWQTSGGGELSTNEGERTTFTASEVAGQYDITVTDSTGQTTNSRVVVYSGELQITPESLILLPGETARLDALLGLPDYQWHAKQGQLSATDGETVTYTAPTDADEDVIELQDATGQIKTLRVFINNDTCKVVKTAIDDYFKKEETDVKDRIKLFRLLEPFVERNEAIHCQ